MTTAARTPMASPRSLQLRAPRFTPSALFIIPAIGVFLLHGLLIKTVTRDLKTRRRLLTHNVSSYSRWALRRLGVDVHATFRSDLTENYLIVANHLSYLDILVIASIVPAVFVTSLDLGEMFFLGTMAEIGASLFVERRNRDRIDHDRSQIAERLRDGFHVVLFPEGTSSNGETVLPFKKGLLSSAMASGRKILPLTLKYTHIDGEPFSSANRDQVCWYGKMQFLPHFLSLMSRRSVTAQLSFHLPIIPRQGDTTEVLAKWTYRIVSESYL